MRISVTQDIDVFLAGAGQWLTKAPVENNTLLTTIAAQQAGHAKGSQPATYIWAEDSDAILGALRWPPPLPATLTAMPATVAAALAAELVDRDVVLPGVNGPAEAVAAFADRWTELSGQPVRHRRELVISQVEQVKLTEWPTGRMRHASDTDAPVLAEWITSVLAQAGLPSPGETARQQIQEQLSGGRLFVWEDDGQMVAVTGHAAPVEGVALVHGVYASPEHRNSWYGTGIVAAVSAHILEQGYTCIAISDSANRHMSAALRMTGYQPVAGLVDCQFQEINRHPGGGRSTDGAEVPAASLCPIC